MKLRKSKTQELHTYNSHSEIFNLYHCTADNIGDLMCGPGQYLWPNSNRNLPLIPIQEHIDNAIIGGGQIFSQLSLILESIYKINPTAKTIAWGVGLPPEGIKDKLANEVAQKFTLFGTRNYDRRRKLDFVPCASCLSPIFDRVEPPEHEVVFYLHRRKGKPVRTPHTAPIMTNAKRSSLDVIKFIASGATVVTSSYHGVYWAQLLGRKVVCIPYNNKFETFQHRPVIADADDWRSGLTLAVQNLPLLEEYRSINHEFAKKVQDIWNA